MSVASSPTLLFVLPMAMTRPSSGGVAICCALPVLWMTSCLNITATNMHHDEGVCSVSKSLRRGCIYSRHLFGGGGFLPHPKNLQFTPPNGCQIMCCKSLPAGTTNCKYITETFFQWTINRGNYSLLFSNQKENLCLKCTEVRLAAARTRWGSLRALPDPVAAMGTLLLWGWREAK